MHFLFAFLDRVSNTTTWAENSNRVVQRSQAERGKSAQLRSDIENLVNMVAAEVWDAWSSTNNALARRAAEILEVKSKLQMHLHKVSHTIKIKRCVVYLKIDLCKSGLMQTDKICMS